MQRRRRASSPSVTSAANRPSRCAQHSKATVIRLGGNRTTVRRRGYRVAAHYGPGSLRRGVDRPPRLLYNGVEGNDPTLRIGQLDERTVGASAPVAALFCCTCCIIRLSAATELAASSSGLMQADGDIPSHAGCMGSRGSELAPGRHGELQVARVHRIRRMMQPLQLRSFARR